MGFAKRRKEGVLLTSANMSTADAAPLRPLPGVGLMLLPQDHTHRPLDQGHSECGPLASAACRVREEAFSHFTESFHACGI